MQFLFVMYHYYHVEEAYSVIRALVSSYVWLTGFGNVTFFTSSNDFGLLRFSSMLWRLNLSALLLCLVMGNSYLLYYIVPLHTFYFCVIFFSMGLVQRANKSGVGMSCKILLAGIAMWAVWDLPSVFETLWSAVLPGKPGDVKSALHEWHFRTGLDHYSCLLGMVFAHTFPELVARMKRAEVTAVLAVPGVSRVALFRLALACAAISVWAINWAHLPKAEYNAIHPYICVIPILGFVLLRNATPSLRSYYSDLLNQIGKISLETYLLQHHVYLTSNAKTLLVLIPGYPVLNLVLASVLFICASLVLNQVGGCCVACVLDPCATGVVVPFSHAATRSKYSVAKVTIRLRSLLIPDDPGVLVPALARLAVTALVLGGLGVLLKHAALPLGAAFLVTVFCGLCAAAYMAHVCGLFSSPLYAVDPPRSSETQTTGDEPTARPPKHTSLLRAVVALIVVFGK